MKIRNAYLYLFLVLFQVCLLFIAFPAFFHHGGSVMFCNWGDGAKNYFTLYSYVKEPLTNEGLFKYNSFAYPFGDYVYYTDNTPLFSIPFRWFCRHISDISAYTIPAFNMFILSNLVVSSLLSFFIFKRLLGKNIFSFGLAVFLPWINIQTLRIWEGDFNLSCSASVLAAIFLFILWYDNAGRYKKQALIAAGSVMLLFLSFLLHGYYIAIVSVFLGAMLFFSGIVMFKKGYGKLSLLMSVVIPATGLTAVLALLYCTDKYLGIRPKNAMCYDYAALKTGFIMLFTHYDFHTLAFPVASSRALEMEISVYLGNIGLFAFAGIWLGAVLSTSFRQRVFAIQKDFFSDALRKSVFLAGCLMLIISFGEYYSSKRDKLLIYTPFRAINDIGTDKLLVYVAILSVVIYGIVLAVSGPARRNLKKIGNDYKQHPYKKALLLACIALMIFLFVGRYAVTIVNLLNPFFYLHFLTNEVEQFRSLSRFSWPFFWVFYVWIVYTLQQLYCQSGKRTKVSLLISFLAVGMLEVSDYVIKARHDANNDNLFGKEQLRGFGDLKIDFKKYQSVLPFPYYIVGSEDYPHTIDDNGDWSTYTMQLSLYSQLPLMSCKMSRTPPEFSLALLNFVSKDSIQPAMRNRLNGRPILVAVNKGLLNDHSQGSRCTGDRPLTMEYYNKANDFINRHHLVPIDSAKDVFFYSWNP